MHVVKELTAVLKTTARRAKTSPQKYERELSENVLKDFFEAFDDAYKVHKSLQPKKEKQDGGKSKE